MPVLTKIALISAVLCLLVSCVEVPNKFTVYHVVEVEPITVDVDAAVQAAHDVNTTAISVILEQP